MIVNIDPLMVGPYYVSIDMDLQMYFPYCSLRHLFTLSMGMPTSVMIIYCIVTFD
jgi:hypothetical protein